MSPRLLASMLALCRMDIRARTSFGRVAVSSSSCMRRMGPLVAPWLRHGGMLPAALLVRRRACQRRSVAPAPPVLLPFCVVPLRARQLSLPHLLQGLRLLFLHLPFSHLHRRRRWRSRLQHLRPAHFLLHCKESTWRTPSSNVTGRRLGGCQCGACRWVAWPIGMSAHFTPLELARRTS